jgi:uncharacterized protein (TIGR02246 family)
VKTPIEAQTINTGIVMINIRIPIIATVLLACSCLAAGNRDTPESLDKAWNKAILANDLDALVACYATDAVAWLPDGAPAKGKDAIRQVYAGILQANTVTAATLTNTHYHTCGDMAVAWGEYTLALTPKTGGSPVTQTGRYSEIAKKEGGKWVYAVDHASANPSAPATP